MDTGTLSPIIKRLEKSALLMKQRNDPHKPVVRLFLTEKTIQIQPTVAKIKQKFACYTGLASEGFFKLLDRLYQLAKSLNIQEASKSAASWRGNDTCHIFNVCI